MKTNTTKTNVTLSNAKLEKLYKALCKCETKRSLVDTLNSYGLRTTTTPTDTKNKNDLYIQFNDKSRLLITNKSLKIYTCDKVASDITKLDKKFVFNKVNDGSYRVKRAIIQNTIDNFKTVFTYFLNGKIDILPQLEK